MIESISLKHDFGFKQFIVSRYPNHKKTIYDDLFFLNLRPIKVKDIYTLYSPNNPLPLSSPFTSSSSSSLLFLPLSSTTTVTTTPIQPANITSSIINPFDGVDNNFSNVKNLAQFENLIIQVLKFSEEYLKILRNNYDVYKINKKSYEDSQKMFGSLEIIYNNLINITECKTLNEFDHIINDYLNDLNMKFTIPLNSYYDIMHKKLYLHITVDIPDDYESQLDDITFEQSNIHYFNLIQELNNQLIGLKNQLNVIDNPQYTHPDQYAKSASEIKIHCISYLNDMRSVINDSYILFEFLYTQRRKYITSFYIDFVKYFELVYNINLNAAIILKLLYLMTSYSENILQISEKCLNDLKSITYPVTNSTYNANIMKTVKEKYHECQEMLKIQKTQMKSLVKLENNTSSVAPYNPANSNHHLLHLQMSYLRGRITSELEDVIPIIKERVESISNLLNFYETIAECEKRYWKMIDKAMNYLNRTTEILKNHQFKKGEESKLSQEAFELIVENNEIIKKIEDFNKLPFYQPYYPKFLEIVKKLKDLHYKLSNQHTQIIALSSFLQNLQNSSNPLTTSTIHGQTLSMSALANFDQESLSMMIQNAENLLQRNSEILANDPNSLILTLMNELNPDSIEVLIIKLLNLIRENQQIITKLTEMLKKVNQSLTWKITNLINKMQSDLIVIKYLHIVYDCYNFFNIKNIKAIIQNLNVDSQQNQALEDLYLNITHHIQECNQYKNDNGPSLPIHIIKIGNNRIILETGILTIIKLIKNSIANSYALIEFLKKHDHSIILFNQQFLNNLSKLLLQCKFKTNIENDLKHITGLNHSQIHTMKSILNIHYTNLSNSIDFNEEYSTKLIQSLEFLNSIITRQISLLNMIITTIENNISKGKVNSLERSNRVDQVQKAFNEYCTFYGNITEIRNFLKNLGMRKLVKKVENLNVLNEKMKEYGIWNDFFINIMKYMKELRENEEDPDYSINRKNQIIKDYENKYSQKQLFSNIYLTIKAFYETNF